MVRGFIRGMGFGTSQQVNRTVRYIVDKLSNTEDDNFIGHISVQDQDNILRAEMLLDAGEKLLPHLKPTFDLLRLSLRRKMLRTGSVNGERAEQYTKIAQSVAFLGGGGVPSRFDEGGGSGSGGSGSGGSGSGGSVDGKG